MSTASPPRAPAFGHADLSNCEREQIHLAGSIQPHGALLLVREVDGVVVQESANAAEFLGLEGTLVGRSLGKIDGELATCFTRCIKDPLHSVPRAVRFGTRASADWFDGLIHRPAGGGVVVELERAGTPVDFSEHVQAALDSIVRCMSLRSLAERSAEVFKQLTGYDRVMIYRFDEEGHGEVLSEQREPSLEAYLGNRYPASDIPQMARRLYERNRVRVLVDVNAQSIPLQPRLCPLTGKDLDMSLCFLRSMSPIHIQYLKNMGVNATLVVSIVVGGALWGLIACHHYAPRFVHYEMRATCELLAEIIATRIAALESFAHTQADLSVQRLQQRLAEAMDRHGDWKAALFDSHQALLSPTAASGAALLFEGQPVTAGEVPGTRQLREIRDWLDSQPRADVFATTSLSEHDARFEPLKPIACGLLAVPVSSDPGEYFVWFRPERIHTVTWGGDPTKPVETATNDPTLLSPRRSFAQWRELVEGKSERWSAADRTAARRIGQAITDIVLQYRSVRMLIAEDQLKEIREQVRNSSMPVVITNQTGRISLLNEAFEQLVGGAHPHLEWIDDLAACFEGSVEAREVLGRIQHDSEAWMGEMLLRNDLGEPRSVLVRADPVRSSSDKVLGTVLTFSDISERRTAAAARQRFQKSILENQRLPSEPLDLATHAVYRRLHSRIISYAQLAALEITDGMQLNDIPRLLEQLRSSVTRSAHLLQYMLAHSREAAGNPADDED